MPTLKSHIDAAKLNQDALSFLIPAKPKFPEWIAVVAFYKALHLVEAAFASRKMDHGQNHEDREQTFKKLCRQSAVFYRVLWQASVHARYLECNGNVLPFRIYYRDIVNSHLNSNLVRFEDNLANEIPEIAGHIQSIKYVP